MTQKFFLCYVFVLCVLVLFCVLFINLFVGFFTDKCFIMTIVVGVCGESMFLPGMLFVSFIWVLVGVNLAFT